MTERDLLEVGFIGRPHGTRGEVYVNLLTDRLERLDPGARLLAGDTWLTVARAKPQQNRFLVFFTEITDRATAAGYSRVPLYAEPIDDPDALWVHDVVGATVVTPDGRRRGTCAAVVANPASDLLELDDGTLIPSVFVTGFADGTVTVEVPTGLFDDDDADGASAVDDPA